MHQGQSTQVILLTKLCQKVLYNIVPTLHCGVGGAALVVSMLAINSDGRGSNPVEANSFYLQMLFGKNENKQKKRPWLGQFFKEKLGRFGAKTESRVPSPFGVMAASKSAKSWNLYRRTTQQTTTFIVGGGKDPISTGIWLVWIQYFSVHTWFIVWSNRYKLETDFSLNHLLGRLWPDFSPKPHHSRSQRLLRPKRYSLVARNPISPLPPLTMSRLDMATAAIWHLNGK